MNIKKIILRTDSDPSVGLFASEWQISGDFSFEHKAELDNFKENLIQFWQENVYNDYLSIEHDDEESKVEEQVKAELNHVDLPLVANCKTLEELALVIESLADKDGLIQGSYRKHDAKTMADRCRDFNKKFIPVSAFTRMYDIRDKIIELSENETNELKQLYSISNMEG